MNVTTFLNSLAILLSEFSPEELDPTLKPIDSAGCIPCKKVHYDFIIVGAGSAGSVLANRLSENNNWKVLLLEAGGDENYVSDTPALTSILFGTKFDWNYTTVKQERSCYNTEGYCHYAAGHVMGGTSTINGMDYVRGNPQDYDEWEAMGNTGWSYQDVLPYFLRAENMTISELSASPYHSTDGEQTVGNSKFYTNISEDFMQVVERDGFPRVDYNGKSQIGISRLQFTVRGATRCSTSKAYLDPIRYRKNLVIFKNSKVIKILINPETKIAEGVRFITNGKEYNVYTRKEVIISAGVMNTPKLLMLSGIGPKEHLEQFNIPVLADLAVGKNFQDHSGVSIYFSVDKSTLNCCTEYTNSTIIDYARYKLGELTTPSQQVIAFMNSKNRSSTVPDITVIMGIISQQFTGKSDPSLFAYIGNINPKSVGTITLKSANHNDMPLIDPKYFENKSDMNAVIRGTLKVIKYMYSPLLKKYSINWINPVVSKCRFVHPITYKKLECFVKHTAIAGYHGVGTAKMGTKSDRSAVVDSKLKVYGINGLRVVDASIMPRITRGNTNAPVIMIAEKAADLIRSNYVTNT